MVKLIQCIVGCHGITISLFSKIYDSFVISKKHLWWLIWFICIFYYLCSKNFHFLSIFYLIESTQWLFLPMGYIYILNLLLYSESLNLNFSGKYRAVKRKISYFDYLGFIFKYMKQKSVIFFCVSMFMRISSRAIQINPAGPILTWFTYFLRVGLSRLDTFTDNFGNRWWMVG